MQSWAAAGDRSFEQADRYAKMITALSDGRLKVEAFPAGAIIPVRKEAEGLAKGSVEIAYLPDGWFDAFYQSGHVFSQWVGGLTGVQLMFWDLAGGGRELSQEMVKDVPIHFVAPLTVHPAEVWCHSKKELKTLDDIKGLKIRVGSSSLADIFKDLGTSPVVLSGAEVYESAKRGVIDAFEYVTPSVNWGMGFNEVAEYVYMSPVRAPADRQSVWVTDEAWAALSPDLQELLIRSAEALVPRFFAETIVLDAEALEKFEDYGNKVLPVPAEIDEALIKAANAWLDEKTATDPFFDKVAKSQLRFKKLCEMENVQ